MPKSPTPQIPDERNAYCGAATIYRPDMVLYGAPIALHFDGCVEREKARAVTALEVRRTGSQLKESLE